MAKGGTGDVLARFCPHRSKPETPGWRCARLCGCGRAGELAAEELTEQCLIATDLLRYLPKAIQEIA
jgi:NAD(P)H-hydrate repair Nnr-like enzyme with NAD(P)H-hydrate dehydratase domain